MTREAQPGPALATAPVLSQVKIFRKMLNVINISIQYVFCLLLWLNVESSAGVRPTPRLRRTAPTAVRPGIARPASVSAVTGRLPVRVSRPPPRLAGARVAQRPAPLTSPFQVLPGYSLLF